MRKPRPNTYNPAQALHLIASDRSGLSTELPVVLRLDRARSRCSPRRLRAAHVTLKCASCGRFARYIAGAA